MVYDLVGITPIPSGTQFPVNWESPQTGVKDYGQWYQRCNSVKFTSPVKALVTKLCEGNMPIKTQESVPP